MEIQTDVMKKMPEELKTALQDLYDGKMTQGDFQYLCHNYAYHKHLDDYAFSYPPTVPYRLSVIEKMLSPTTNEEGEAKHLKHQYLRQKSEIDAKNNGNFWWLCEMRSIFEAKGEAEKVEKITVLIRDYQQQGFYTKEFS